MLLEVEDVSVGYGRVGVLRNLSLKVDRGEIVSVLGPNGAGKTTLLRAISGIIPLTNGAVSFNGLNLRRKRPEQRARLGLAHLPEGRGILRTLTVGENLDLGAIGRRDGRAAIAADRERLLEAFPALAGRLHQGGALLSGGQQQMLALARGLFAKPKLLIIDELSFGLAPKIVTELYGTLAGLRETGVAFLIVEQQVSVLRISDRSYVLRSGTTALEGRSDLLAGSDELVSTYFRH